MLQVSGKSLSTLTLHIFAILYMFLVYSPRAETDYSDGNMSACNTILIISMKFHQDILNSTGIADQTHIY